MIFLEKMLLVSFVLFVNIGFGSSLSCLNGWPIFDINCSVQEQNEILKLHNDFREKIMNGTVSNQPRGQNLLPMVYDIALQNIAENLTKSCQFKVNTSVTDPRWPFLGYNIYVKYSSWKTTGPNWTSAFKSWTDQAENFDYDNYQSGKTQKTNAYTQIVWDSTDHLGCYSIFYYDKSRMVTPYTKLYVCYYGPGGNIRGVAPYEKY